MDLETNGEIERLRHLADKLETGEWSLVDASLTFVAGQEEYRINYEARPAPRSKDE